MSKFITKEGLKKIKEELEDLKTTKQKELTERLQKAIAFGDLSENFDYHDAREQQEMLQNRIAELEEQIREAKLGESTNQKDKVQVGSRVEIQIGKEKVEYTIVTAQEANPLEGKISAESPIGSVLLGKKEGEKALCETPGGTMECKILKIE